MDMAVIALSISIQPLKTFEIMVTDARMKFLLSHFAKLSAKLPASEWISINCISNLFVIYHRSNTYHTSQN